MTLSMAKLRKLDVAICESALLDPSNLLEALLSCRPDGATGAYAFKWDYLKDEFLTKLPLEGVPPSVRAKAAIEKMLSYNERCRQVNEEGFLPLSDANLDVILFKAQHHIAKVLGPLHNGYRLSNMMEKAGFTSGATTDHRRVHGDIFYKYRRQSLHVTPRAQKYALSVIRGTPLWRDHEHPKLEQIMGNRVFTVRKSTEIDRAACKEPPCNNMLQVAVGKYIRARLKAVARIDLNDQTINQKLAERGSLRGSLATIDLSGASDSLSQRLVFDLLPLEWVELLDDLRSPYGVLPDGSTVKWELHSTMGNGYTFELESMIFWALCLACRDYYDEQVYTVHRAYHDRDLSVYGDDIICPTYVAPLVLSVLVSVGFKPNEKKTFIRGPFRESCGKHYYEGYDVSPFYLRKPIDSLPRVIWLLNSIRKWSYDSNLEVCDPSTEPLWRRIRRKLVPPELLGCNELTTTRAVHSPEDPRFCVQLEKDKKRINGYPALLRCFQYQNQVRMPNHVKWYDVPYDIWKDGPHGQTCDSTDMTRIEVRDCTPSYRVFRDDGWPHDRAYYPSEV